MKVLKEEKIQSNDRIYLITIKRPDAEEYETVYVLGYDYYTDVKRTVLAKCGADTLFSPSNPIDFCSLEEFIQNIFKNNDRTAFLRWPIILP